MSTLDCDILHTNSDVESMKCKRKQLTPNPNSDFMTLRCPACSKKTTAFSHSGTPIYCSSCGLLLARPTGGRIELTERVESCEKE